MPVNERHIIVYGADGSVVDQDVEPLDPATVNSHAARDKLEQGLGAIEQHIADVKNEIAAWPGYNNAQVSAALLNEVLPAVRDALRGVAYLARQEVGAHSTVPPA